MKRFILLSCVLFVLFLAPFGWWLRVMAKGRPQVLTAAISHDIDVAGQPELILQAVLRDTGISGGVIKFHDCYCVPQPVHLKASRGTSIRAVMATLIAENPEYVWEFRGGVINVIEKPGLPPLLSTKLNSFHADTTDKEVGTLFSDLMRRPEVLQRLTELKLKPGIWTGPRPGVYEENPKPRQPIPIHFNIEDGSLWDAFNSIVTAGQHMIWVYAERACNGDRTYLVDIVQN
jgi:hypothetical protein